MQRIVTTPTPPLESKTTSSWEGITTVLLQLIFNNLGDVKDLVNLSQVNKHYRKVGLSKHTNLGFFSKKYSYNPLVKELMLSPDSISAPHVRAGNQLVKQAIEKIHQGDFIIDALLDRAMYNHGSYLAMQFIAMLSTLPGRVKLNFSMDDLIKLYQEKTHLALEQEITLAFQGDINHSQYVTEMRSALAMFSYQISKNIRAFKSSYYSQISLTEAYYKEGDDFDTTYPALTSKKFNAVGFIGSEKPSDENVWYLQTAAQKEFIQTQQRIDDSFVQPTSTHQPRMMAGWKKP